MRDTLTGPPWLADGVAAIALLAGFHVVLCLVASRRTRSLSDYATDIDRFVCSVALLGLLVPATRLVRTADAARIWIAVVVVFSILVLVGVLGDLEASADRWHRLPQLAISVATVYLLAAPLGIPVSGGSAAVVDDLVGMDKAQMAGMGPGSPKVPGATIDFVLAIAMIAIVVMLVDHTSRARGTQISTIHRIAVRSITTMATSPQSTTIATALLALGCAYLLVMYYA